MAPGESVSLSGVCWFVDYVLDVAERVGITARA
jgi:hypothetical protein